MAYPHPNPLMPRDPRGVPHDAAFRVCLAGLERLLDYIELDAANENTFSHRTHELLLRVSTEFEATCKSVLGPTVARPTIKDYESLSSTLSLPEFFVGFLTGSPTPLIVQPFADWSVPGSPLSWYQSYNRVKHNRSTHFSEASLRNVLLATGALFILLHEAFKPRLYHSGNRWPNDSTKRVRAYFEEFPIFLEQA